MTTREHLAGMAMQGILASESFFRNIMDGTFLLEDESDIEVAVARMARHVADALIAELARTCKESLQVQPDADGWIKHDSSGPVPEKWSWCRFKDGGEWGWDDFADSCWNHTNEKEIDHITHYKP